MAPRGRDPPLTTTSKCLYPRTWPGLVSWRDAAVDWDSMPAVVIRLVYQLVCRKAARWLALLAAHSSGYWRARERCGGMAGAEAGNQLGDLETVPHRPVDDSLHPVGASDSGRRSL